MGPRKGASQTRAIGNSATFLACATVGVSSKIFWEQPLPQTQPHKGPCENGFPDPAVALNEPDCCYFRERIIEEIYFKTRSFRFLLSEANDT